MSEQYSQQVYQSLDMHDTEELLKIWQTNDRYEWSDTAFDAIEVILQERLDELPPQNKVIINKTDSDHSKVDKTLSDYQYLNSGSLPRFYRPKVTLRICRWLEIMSIVTIFVSVLFNIEQIRIFIDSFNDFGYYAGGGGLLDWIWQNIVQMVQIIFKYFLYFFIFRGLAYLLIILMEMEFNSRETIEEVQLQE